MKKILELFRECNKDEVFLEYGAEVNIGFEEHGNTLLVLFEPSDGRIDWRMNFAFARKPYSDMESPYYVHGGFLHCWQQVKAVFKQQIKRREWAHIVITGYSHGGALALLSHECAWYELPHMRDGRIITVAFGAPRIYGGFTVKDELKERWAHAYIIKDNEDLVTHMPPRCFGFADVGRIVQIVNEPVAGCISSHTGKMIQKAILDRINEGKLREIEELLNTTDLWKDNTRA